MINQTPHRTPEGELRRKLKTTQRTLERVEHRNRTKENEYKLRIEQLTAEHKALKAEGSK